MRIARAGASEFAARLAQAFLPDEARVEPQEQALDAPPTTSDYESANPAATIRFYLNDIDNIIEQKQGYGLDEIQANPALASDGQALRGAELTSIRLMLQEIAKAVDQMERRKPL